MPERQRFHSLKCFGAWRRAQPKDPANKGPRPWRFTSETGKAAWAKRQVEPGEFDKTGWQREKYRRLRAGGLCVNCQEESKRFCYCMKCRVKRARYIRERRKIERAA